ncbi:MAG: hypothetical protein ACC742_07355 [Thermoanaerobaculales bacterium]
MLPAEDVRPAEDLLELDECVLGARVVAPRDDEPLLVGRRTYVGERVAVPRGAICRLDEVRG